MTSVQTPVYDILLRGGHVIDPLNNVDGVRDVAVKEHAIAAVAPNLNPALAKKVIDVSGRYVTPGILDIHVHVYHTRAPEGAPEGLSVLADAFSFKSGVTTMVDTGTAGGRQLRHFKHTVIDRARTRIFAFVNIVDDGMIGDFEQDPRHFDAELAASVVEAYPEICVGIKTAHYWTHKPYDDLHTPWAAVDQAIKAAEMCGKPVMYDFWPRPERTYPDLLLKKMRPGDIHTHVFAQQFPIVDEHGRVYRHMFEARERGIIFDLGHGGGSFWFRNGARAITDGFVPDSISTDLHTGSMNATVGDMQTTMSKVLNMGVPLYDVIKLSTVNPAKEIGHPELGHLSPGACADVAVFDLRHGEFGFIDCGRARIVGDRKLECVFTLRGGDIVYDLGGLSAPLWTEAPPAYWRLPEA